MVFWAETSLTGVPSKLSEAIEQHSTNDNLKEVASFANRAITYTSNARISVGTGTIVYILMMIIFWTLCILKFRKVRKMLRSRSNHAIHSDGQDLDG